MNGQDDDDAFAAAWDQREMSELTRDLGPVLRAHGVGRPDRRHARAERERVDGILARDRIDRLDARLAEAAEIEIAEGKFVNLADTAVGPTPEQFAQAERRGSRFQKFTPRGINGTSRTVTAYRRADLPQVQRMVMNGTIDGDGLRDCIWYRNLVESAGLAGNIPSIDYGREVFAAPHSRAPFTDRQIEAQDTLRHVHKHIAPARRALLDKVVLDDVPFSAAFRKLGFRTRRMRVEGAAEARRLFAEIVADLGAARESSGAS